jgi:hypothetical protein
MKKLFEYNRISGIDVINNELLMSKTGSGIFILGVNGGESIILLNSMKSFFVFKRIKACSI